MRHTSERRSGHDRRQFDMGCPTDKERRQRIEQRQLVLKEVTLDEHEWQLLFAAPKQTKAPSHHDELASHVLERAFRDKNAS